MKKLLSATIAAIALGAAGLGLAATATAAPTGAGSAQITINELQADGYHVILTKTGTGPLDQCTVTSVRAGAPVTIPTNNRSRGGKPFTRIIYVPAHVNANC